MAKRKSGFESKAILFAMLMSIFVNTYAMDYYDDKPEIELVVTTADSVMKIHIPTELKEVKFKTNRLYYWYAANKIHSNIGGASGKVLVGDYKVFGSSGELIAYGKFKNGLKNGEWKYWSSEGKLLRTEDWKKGLLDGKVYTYCANGSKDRIISYDDGKKNGKELIFLEDTIFTNKYKNDVLILPKKKANKTLDNKNKTKPFKIFFSFSKKKKIENSGRKKEENNTQTKSPIQKKKSANQRFKLNWPWVNKNK